MIIKKLVAWSLLLSLLVGWCPIAYAQENKNELEGFIDLKQGDLVPEDGLFFNYTVISKVIAKQDAKLAKLTLDKDTEIKKINLELETVTKKKDIEIQINKEMYENLLKIKQDRIDLLNEERKWNDFILAGGFVAGFVASVVIFYAAVQVAK
jgi:hypothetical protein